MRLRIRGGYDHLIAAAILIIVFSAYLLDVFEGVELKTIDYRFKKSVDHSDSQAVTVVEITKFCLEEISAWPIKRSLIAAAIEKVMAAGAKTLAIDILFADRTTPAEDDPLAETFRRHGKRIVLATQLADYKEFRQESGRIIDVTSATPPNRYFLERTSAETGLINIEYSGSNRDGVIRRVTLQKPYENELVPLLSFAGVINFTGKEPGKLGIPPQYLSSDFLINYYRDYKDTPFTKIPFATLLSENTDEVAGLLADRLVFLGISAPAVPDMRLTPYGVMPGIEIHATVADNILRSRYAFRATALANLLIFSLFAFAYARYLRAAPGIWDIPALALVLGAYAGVAWLMAAKYRIFLDVVPPAAQAAAQFIFVRLYQNVRQVYLANRELSRMLDRIGGLYNIARLSHKVTDLQLLLNTTVIEMAKILKCKRVSIVIEDPRSGSLLLKAGIGFDNTDKPIENLILNRKSPVITRVMESGEPLLIRNIDEDAALRGADGGVSYQTKSFVCVPLMINNSAIGALSLTDKENFENFTDDDLKTITVFSNQIATNIEHVFRIADEVEKKRVDRELEIASVMQKKLVPSGIKSVPGFEIYGTYIPATEVSGDYYDCIELDSDHLMLVVGDVSGKGVPAGLFMFMTRTFLHTIIKNERDLSKIIGSLNDYLTDNSESTAYLTVFIGILDKRTGALEYANGGHLSPIVVKKDGTLENLEVKNLICGMFSGIEYEVGKTVLAPGETLYIFTDGVTEAQAADESMYGYEILNDTVRALPSSMSAAEKTEKILDSVKAFVKDAPQSDDITILTVSASEIHS